MSKDLDKAFFGHPAGLSTLFFTEMWERLSYYGARAFLFIFMTTTVAKGGLGLDDAAAGLVMALYLSSVYLLSLPGGWIADRFLGQRRAVTLGGIGIMLGNAFLALPSNDFFYPGLGLIAIGTGLLKPNVSTIVGQLYKKDDLRRDAGYTIYYMGINIGAFFAPFIGWLMAESSGFRVLLADNGIDPNMAWKFAYAVPAVGMALGIVQYLIGYKKMGEAGLHPTIPSDPKKASRDRVVLLTIIGGLVAIVGGAVGLDAAGIVSFSEEAIGNAFGVGLLIAAVALFIGLYKTARDHGERKRVTAMIPLFLGAVAFFAVFEQASTTLSAYAKRLVDRDLIGFHLEASGYQLFNAFFIIVLASPFAYMWTRLAKSGKEPSVVTKFAIGMVLAALSFVVLIPSLGSITQLDELQKAALAVNQNADLSSIAPHLRVSGMYLVALYFVSTLSEMFISPVGLSSMSKLAPERLAGMVMGTWFLATAIGNYLAGRAAGFSQARGYSFLVYTLIISSLVVAAILFMVAPMIKRMLAGKASAPADHSEKAEPDPLPAARTLDD